MHYLLLKILFMIITTSLMSCTNNAENAFLHNWNINKYIYIDIVRDTSNVFIHTDIKEITPNNIRTANGTVIEINKIEQLYPKYSSEILNSLSSLKKLNASIDYGIGYVSFFILSGGVLASDNIVVYTDTNDGMINFVNDNAKIGYTVLSQKKIDQNWYLVDTD